MSSNKTSEFFDAYAGDFDAIYGTRNTLFNRVVNKYFRKSMRTRYTYVINGCEPIDDCTVLDIGCGPGHYSVSLAIKGAKKVTGVDFADTMLEIATGLAVKENVDIKCEFINEDFNEFSADTKYDYTIVIGFMDYIEQPAQLIKKVLSLTKKKAFFSFPADGGFLAWQRKQRYKSRCELYLYTEEQIKSLFTESNCVKFNLENLGRDYFVTAYM